jgi:hypothetical protein
VDAPAAPPVAAAAQPPLPLAVESGLEGLDYKLAKGYEARSTMDHELAPSPLVHGPVASVHRVFFRKIIRLIIEFPWHFAIKPLSFVETNPQSNSL